MPDPTTQARKLRIVDPQSGDTVRVVWSSPDNPTDQDINDILSAHRTRSTGYRMTEEQARQGDESRALNEAQRYNIMRASREKAGLPPEPPPLQPISGNRFAVNQALKPFQQTASTLQDVRQAASKGDWPLRIGQGISAAAQGGMAATGIPSLLETMKGTERTIPNSPLPIPARIAETAMGAIPGVVNYGLREFSPNFGMSPEAASVNKENLANAIGMLLMGKMGEVATPKTTGNVTPRSIEGTPLYTPAEYKPSKSAKMLKLALKDRVDTQTIDRTMPEIFREHNLKPITSVADLTASANAAISKISEKLSPIINQKFKNNFLATSDVMSAAQQALSREEWTPQDRAKALQSLRDLGITEDGALDLPKMDRLRKKLGEETSPYFNMSSEKKAMTNISKAEMVAKLAAADALRSQIYGELESYGVKGADKMRQRQGRLIELRNAAQATIDEAEKSHPPSRLRGIARSPMIAGSVVYGLGKSMGLPIGTDILAGAAAKAAADASRTRYTPNELVGRAFGKVKGKNVGAEAAITGVPENLGVATGREMIVSPQAESARRVREGQQTLARTPEATSIGTLDEFGRSRPPVGVAPFEMPAPRELPGPSRPVSIPTKPPKPLEITSESEALHARRVAEGKRKLAETPEATSRSTFPSPVGTAPFEMPAPREFPGGTPPNVPPPPPAPPAPPEGGVPAGPIAPKPKAPTGGGTKAQAPTAAQRNITQNFPHNAPENIGNAQEMVGKDVFDKAAELYAKSKGHDVDDPAMADKVGASVHSFAMQVLSGDERATPFLEQAKPKFARLEENESLTNKAVNAGSELSYDEANLVLNELHAHKEKMKGIMNEVKLLREAGDAEGARKLIDENMHSAAPESQRLRETVEGYIAKTRDHPHRAMTPEDIDRTMEKLRPQSGAPAADENPAWQGGEKPFSQPEAQPAAGTPAENQAKAKVTQEKLARPKGQRPTQPRAPIKVDLTQEVPEQPYESEANVGAYTKYPTPKVVKATVLDGFKKAHDVLKQEFGREIDVAAPEKLKYALKQARIPLTKDGRVVVDVPGDGHFEVAPNGLKEMMRRVESRFPESQAKTPTGGSKIRSIAASNPAEATYNGPTEKLKGTDLYVVDRRVIKRGEILKGLKPADPDNPLPANAKPHIERWMSEPQKPIQKLGYAFDIKEEVYDKKIGKNLDRSASGVSHAPLADNKAKAIFQAGPDEYYVFGQPLLNLGEKGVTNPEYRITSEGHLQILEDGKIVSLVTGEKADPQAASHVWTSSQIEGKLPGALNYFSQK